MGPVGERGLKGVYWTTLCGGPAWRLLLSPLAYRETERDLSPVSANSAALLEIPHKMADRENSDSKNENLGGFSYHFKEILAGYDF